MPQTRENNRTARLMSGSDVIGSLKVTARESVFLAQVLDKINPSGIEGTEIKLSLMKKVNALRSLAAEPPEESDDGNS